MEIKKQYKLNLIFWKSNNTESDFSYITGYKCLIISSNRLRILNEKFTELNSFLLPSNQVFISIQCFGNKIVSISRQYLTPESSQSHFYIRLFDNEIKQQLVAKRYPNSLKLISINESEVLCYSPQTCKLIIFNHNLEQVLCLGQTTSESDRFFFKNGTLVDANRHFIIFYNTNPRVQHNNNFQEQSIKILSRRTGMSVGEITIESEYFSLLLKLDLHDNIFYKPQHPLDVLHCYQAPSGNLINEFVNPRFIGMSSMAVTKNNQMVCVNRRDNLMYII